MHLKQPCCCLVVHSDQHSGLQSSSAHYVREVRSVSTGVENELGRQGGRVVRVLDFESVGPGYESHSEHFMDLFHGSPEL